MCVKGGETNLKWQTNLPQEEGDYLWIEQWDCGCVLRSGVAWAFESCEEDDRPAYRYKNDKGEWMGLSWEGQGQPYHDESGVPQADFWAKVDLPRPKH